MKINIISFFTLILLSCNAFGMEQESYETKKKSSRKMLVHLEVNKSETLFCSIDRDLFTNESSAYIWQIVYGSAQAPSLLKMKGPKSFLQSLPPELIAELLKFTRCNAPQDSVLIRAIYIDSRIRYAKFDSNDNLYFYDDKRNLEMWQKKNIKGILSYFMGDDIRYLLVHKLSNQDSFCLNSNTLITSANNSITIFNILKKADPENTITLEVTQTLPIICVGGREERSRDVKELSHDSFFVCDGITLKVYKKEERDAFYTLIKQIETGEGCAFKAPNMSIIIIKYLPEGIYGKVWLKENKSNKPSYEFCKNIKYQRFINFGQPHWGIWVDDLGRILCHTPQETIDILHNDPLNPQDYKTIAQLLNRESPHYASTRYSHFGIPLVIALSTLDILFINRWGNIKIWPRENPAHFAGFKALVTECSAEKNCIVC